MLTKTRYLLNVKACPLIPETCRDVGGHRVGIRQDVNDHRDFVLDIDELVLEARLCVNVHRVPAHRSIDEFLFDVFLKVGNRCKSEHWNVDGLLLGTSNLDVFRDTSVSGTSAETSMSRGSYCGIL